MDYKEISGGSILLPMLPIGFQSRELASVGSLPISALLLGPCIDNFTKKKAVTEVVATWLPPEC